MFIRAYLRASTLDQNADRARVSLDRFATERGLEIASYYVENVSGATLDRPRLNDLLRDSKENDVLLIEGVDRLTRLEPKDWAKLKRAIEDRGLRIVSLDLPTSWELSANTGFTADVMKAINTLILDILASVGRKDYEDRRRRQAQGIARAKEKGVYKGRPENVERNAHIATLLRKGVSWNDIVRIAGVSRQTVSKVAQRVKAETEAA